MAKGKAILRKYSSSHGKCLVTWEDEHGRGSAGWTPEEGEDSMEVARRIIGNDKIKITYQEI